MKIDLNIEERKPIWIALSDFYLDTELQDYDIKHIATAIRESPYTLEEVKEIDKQEIFPVLYSNLLYAAGAWTGFQEEWLIDKITEAINSSNRYRDFFLRIKYARLKWMYTDYWKKLEAEYRKT